MDTVRTWMTKAPRTISSSTTVGETARLFEEEAGLHHLPVLGDNGGLVGVVSEHDVRTWRRAWEELEAWEAADVSPVATSWAIRELLTTKAITVPPGESIADVASMMSERYVEAVVVVEEGRPIGILTATDLLRRSESVGPPAARTVGELMTEAVFSLTAEDGLDAALELMLDQGVRHVPVVDDEGSVVGVVSHRDVLAQGRVSETVDEDGEIAARFEGLRDVQVGDVMSEPETVGPEVPLSEAAALLLENGYGCLPVVENRRLVGIITEADFVRLAAAGP